MKMKTMNVHVLMSSFASFFMNDSAIDSQYQFVGSFSKETHTYKWTIAPLMVHNLLQCPL